jgi:hypothetical protein
MKRRCEQVEQITIFLENRPGMLADLCAHLSDLRVNIRAMAVLENTESGSVRLVADDPEAAKAALAEAGVAFTTDQCLALEMPNTPGGFAAMARTLAVAGINIDYIYASVQRGTPTALGIFHVSDPERALALDWQP